MKLSWNFYYLRQIIYSNHFVLFDFNFDSRRPENVVWLEADFYNSLCVRRQTEKERDRKRELKKRYRDRDNKKQTKEETERERERERERQKETKRRRKRERERILSVKTLVPQQRVPPTLVKNGEQKSIPADSRNTHSSPEKRNNEIFQTKKVSIKNTT